MRSISLLSLLVVLAIGYLLYFRSAAPAPDGAASAKTSNGDVYKADMDQAHAAARLMAKDREESVAH